MTGRSLLIELDAADLLQLEHLSRSTGQPRAVVAGALISAGLAADRRSEAAPTDPNQQLGAHLR